MNYIKHITILSILATAVLFCTAQEKKKDKDEKPKWDVNNPPGNWNTVDFSVNEGTWMNVDVSPDGGTIVFDLLGDIYTLPITGGTATAIRTGIAYEVQPRFSPDGKQICFTSDAGGADNVWVCNTDGSDAKQVTKEDFRLLNNPIWMPDNEYLVARKHFTSERSLGAGELWLYHKSGGKGLQLTKRKNDQQDLNEPSVSPDGRYVYYSEDMYGGGYFKYNKDPNSQIYVIKRFDREKGESKTIISGPGGAARPEVSNDGSKLAFVRRVRTQSTLFIHDLKTGEEWPVFDGLSKDQQEAWAIFGVYTGFSWLPGDKNIVIWGQGKLWNVDVEKASATEIPFTVNAEHQLAETVRFKQKVDTDKFTVNVIRQAKTSPDGKVMVFNAVGYLWKKDLPDGKPQRLTSGTDFEYEPSFSPDGKSIVYATWNDEEHGALQTLTIKGKAKPTKITTEKGFYQMPSYSPDGQMIVYKKGKGNGHMGYTHGKLPGIYIASENGSNAKRITTEGSAPLFDKTGKKIFYQTGGGLEKKYKQINIDKTEEKTLFTAKYARAFTPSPDNKWIAFTELFKVYIAAMPQTGKEFELSKDTKAVPIQQVAKDAGINLHWSANSDALNWTLGEEYFTAKLTDRFLFLENAADSIPPMDSLGLRIGLELETDKPKGTIVFKNANIITINKKNEVIENGMLVVEDNKIKYVGEANDEDRGDAKVVDVDGKTIMPGLVDTHAHLNTWRQGHSPQKQWSYYANLAYGVTATHDPSSNTEMVFSQSEMVKAGHLIGPRIFSTGTILYGADGDFKQVVTSLEDANSAMRRMKAFGAFSVKSYNQPRRNQRQQVIEAARNHGIMVYPEGGSFFFHNMSMVVDGHTSVEHNIPVAPLYDDVIQLWKRTETGNTPTLVVNYGGINGEYYWYQNTNVWEKKRLLDFTPRAVVDSRSRHRTMIPDEEYENGHILTSKSCKKLSDNDVNVCVGSHGQLQGLAAHWELWMLHQGGMDNMQALRAATINGAKYIGMEEEIGSLEEGKLADLIVLDKNPLDDIYNTEFVAYTMINGRLYDSATMNEIGHRDLPRKKFYWEQNKYSSNFEYHQQTNSFMRPTCGCYGAH